MEKFSEVTQKAVDSGEFEHALTFMEQNFEYCQSDPKSIDRLLNELADKLLSAQLRRAYEILLRFDFTFESIHYAHSLNSLLETNE